MVNTVWFQLNCQESESICQCADLRWPHWEKETTVIKRTAIRGIDVSRQSRVPNWGHSLKPLRPSQSTIVLRGLRGSPWCREFPIIFLAGFCGARHENCAVSDVPLLHFAVLFSTLFLSFALFSLKRRSIQWDKCIYLCFFNACILYIHIYSVSGATLRTEYCKVFFSIFFSPQTPFDTMR